MRKLGALMDSSTAFKMKSGNRRSPDISFVAKERLQGLERRFSNPKSPMTIMKNHKDTKDTKFFIMQFMNTESVF
jgi:hypothetical protein